MRWSLIPILCLFPVCVNASDIKIEATSHGDAKIMGYKGDTFLIQRQNDSIDIKASASNNLTIGIEQEGNNNKILIPNITSENGNVDLEIKQSGNYNELELDNVYSFKNIYVDVQQLNGSNKIHMKEIKALEDDVNLKIKMINTGNLENKIGGVIANSIYSLSDVASDMQFSYSEGAILKGSGINGNITVYGTDNRIGIYQQADSGNAEVNISIGNSLEDSSGNEVLVYQHNTVGGEAFAKIDIEGGGDGRTVKVYQDGDAWVDISVSKDYTSSGDGIIVYQKANSGSTPHVTISCDRQ